MNRHFIISVLMTLVWIAVGIIGIVQGGVSKGGFCLVMGVIFAINAFRSMKKGAK